jgi:hypothetical protein
MPDPVKYKSVGLSVEFYNKLNWLAKMERRCLGQELGLLIDREIERVKRLAHINAA